MRIVEWYLTDGSFVRAGQKVCAVAEGDSEMDFEALHDGILKTLLPAGTEIQPGELGFRIDPIDDTKGRRAEE